MTMTVKMKTLTEKNGWRLRFPVILAVCAFVFLAGSLSGQAATERLYATGTRMWGDTNKGVTYFEGNVVIVKGDLRITCQYAEIDNDRDTGKITGGVILSDKGVIIKADTLEIDLRKKQGIFRGNVSLLREEEKAKSGEVLKERVELICQVLDGNTSKRSFLATGSAKLIHPDFTATCQSVSFNETTERLIMEGNVLLIRKRDELKAGKVDVDLKAKKFTATEGVELNFEIESEEDGETAETGKDGSDGEDNAAPGGETPSGTTPTGNTGGTPGAGEKP